jgi:actin-related protein
MIGHNRPPLAVEVRERHKDLFVKLDELESAHELVPPVILDDETEGAAQDVYKKCKIAVKTATAMHKLEKEPYDTAIKELKATFAIPSEKVDKAAEVILKRIDAYKEKKAIEERRKREEEARKVAEEAARKQREAEEADRKRREAEEARREEEERAAKAQAEREKAEREAREARERADRLKEEQARMERERKEREAREAEEAKVRAQRNAEEEARRKAEREEHDRKMADLAKQRAEEEAKAKAAREEAAKALAERRAAEDAAAAAKREEKAAEREADHNLDDAVRLERRSAKLEDAANASEAELSRGRGDYGSVGSRATFWTWRMLDRDAVPLEALRAYIHPDAIDAAVTRFMNAHRPELGQGRDMNDLLPGIEFYRDTQTRVA